MAGQGGLTRYDGPQRRGGHPRRDIRARDQPVPAAGLEPATCALRRRPFHLLGERTVSCELGSRVCLYNEPAEDNPPLALGGGWDRKVPGPFRELRLDRRGLGDVLVEIVLRRAFHGPCT